MNRGDQELHFDIKQNTVAQTVAKLFVFKVLPATLLFPPATFKTFDNPSPASTFSIGPHDVLSYECNHAKYIVSVSHITYTDKMNACKKGLFYIKIPILKTVIIQ